MKSCVSILIGVFLVGLTSCEKTQEVSDSKLEESEIRIEQLTKELGKTREELDELRGKNEELTKRIIDAEAKSSSMTKLLALGAKKYKSGADRAACILNIRNIHQAVRAHQNLYGHDIGDKIVWSEIIGPGKYIEVMPKCPHGATYSLVDKFPKVGTPAAVCPHAKEHEHEPNSTRGW